MDGAPFGRYRLIEVIGQGSVGEVYRAFDTETRRDVAVKVLSGHVAADETFRERFRREALVTAKLRDPHVIPIHAFGEIDGRLYLDMRLIDGSDLRMRIHTEPGGIPPAVAVSYIEQMAGALDAAHAHGLLHRDVKPSNMLISSRDFVYLIDFGIARGITDASLTNVGTTVGTMAYMAPERFGNEGAGPSSDIYSLTCVLHECLTGQPPFPGQTLEQQVAAHLTADRPRPTDVRPELPAGFDAVIARGMARDPEDRFADAGELAAAARRALATAPDPAALARAAAARSDSDLATPTATVATPLRATPVPFAAGEWSVRTRHSEDSNGAGDPDTAEGVTLPTGRPAPARTGRRRRQILVAAGALAVVGATATATGAAVLQSNSTETRTAAATVAPTTEVVDPTPEIAAVPAPAPATTAPATTAATTTPAPTTTTPTTTTAPPVGTPSFEQMSTFVRGYYNLLPQQPDSAWNDLGSTYAASTGRSGFDSFWATIDSVTVTSVRPRDASSVVVGLTYRTTTGAVDTESRWVSVEVDDGGALRIANSNRL